jgi:Transposase, Mutator family
MALSQSALSELLDAFRAGDGVDQIRESVRLVLQELIEVEATEVIGAAPYERTDTRTTERNGARPRLLATQAGGIELKIPKLRKGSFFPSILEPCRRIDQALYAVVMEAYVAGVSTRAVDDVVAALGISSGSPSPRCRASAPGWMRSSGRSERVSSTTSSSTTSTWTRPTCTFATPPRRSRRWPSSWRRGSRPTATGTSSAATSATARRRRSGVASCAR